MKKILLSFIVAAFSLGAFAQTPTPGTPVPSAIFYRTDGTVFSTSQIPKGKKSLIMFFDATCDHCQRAATTLSKNAKDLTKLDIYLVTQDEPRSINYFMDNFGKSLKTMKNVTVLQDKDHVFIPVFHPKQYPSLYLYGADKKLTLYSSDEKEVPKFINLVK